VPLPEVLPSATRTRITAAPLLWELSAASPVSNSTDIGNSRHIGAVAVTQSHLMLRDGGLLLPPTPLRSQHPCNGGGRGDADSGASSGGGRVAVGAAARRRMQAVLASVPDDDVRNAVSSSCQPKVEY
jgi:hypothetical protein